jgi:DNA-directed RNA polymerase specialized sigma24 family protein
MRTTPHTVTDETARATIRAALADALDTVSDEPERTICLAAWILETVEEDLEPIRTARAAAVRQLRAEGFTLAELAELSGLSRARIDQIAKR